MGENNSKCHLWYAILLGDTCKYDDTKMKLIKGMEFEKHVKRSLELDPYNSTALHLLGRYCFEVWMVGEVITHQSVSHKPTVHTRNHTSSSVYHTPKSHPNHTSFRCLVSNGGRRRLQ